MPAPKNLFLADTYRSLLTLAMERMPGKKVRFAHLADAIRVQRPYLSKVMVGNAELNRDQLYLAARFLSLSAAEMHLAQLLLERERSGLSERKAELQKEIESIRGQHREIKKNLAAPAAGASAENLSRYYLNPLLLLVHIGLTVERNRAQPEFLRRELNLPKENFQELLQSLGEIGLIRVTKGKVQLLKDHLHLPKDSPLFSAHQQLLRLLCLQRLRSSAPSDTAFSVTFSATETVRAKVHEKFLEFLRNAEIEVRDCAEPAAVYQMNFDLFHWTSPAL